MAFPDRPADRDLLRTTRTRAPDRCGCAGFFSSIEPASARTGSAPRSADRRGRAAGLDRALRHADREHARQPAADGERLVGVEQRVDELADAFFGDLAQRPHRVLGDRIPGEQRDHVRNQRGGSPSSSRSTAEDARRDCATAAPGSPAPPGRPTAGCCRGRRAASVTSSASCVASRPACRTACAASA